MGMNVDKSRKERKSSRVNRLFARHCDKIAANLGNAPFHNAD